MIRTLEKYVVKPVIRPLSKKVSRLHDLVPETEVYDQIDHLFSSIDGIIDLLSDGTKTTVRLVMNPEKMVIKESMRALTYLNLYGITVDQVVINRVFIDEIDGEYMSEWKTIQHKYIEQIEHSFAPIPITKVPLFRREVLGLEMLKTVGEVVYGDKNPLDIFYKEEHTSITKISEGHYIMKLRLPFVFDNKMEANVLQIGDSLSIRIGNYQKGVILPLFLAGMRVAEAGYEEKWLKIEFRKKNLPAS